MTRSRTSLVGAFSLPRRQQGVPMRPVPMSGMTGQPQGPHWSIADAIMASPFTHDEDDDVGDVEDIPNWDEWNTPRYDMERFYITDVSDPARVAQYLEEDGELMLVQEYVRLCINEFNAIGSGPMQTIRGTIATDHVRHDDEDDDEQRGLLVIDD